VCLCLCVCVWGGTQNSVVCGWRSEEPQFDYRRGQQILPNVLVFCDVISRGLCIFEEDCRASFTDTAHKVALREKGQFEKFFKMRNNSPLLDNTNVEHLTKRCSM
jgi:hypothetical protein